MASTVIRGAQIKDSTVQRHDLDTSTVGQAVVTKIVQGSGINLSSTGADSGTGDVTVAASAIPLASSAQSGLLNQLSGNTTDFVDGTNACQPLQPVIWSATRRVFNAVSNPTFEVDQRNIGQGIVNVSNGVFAQDRWVVAKSGTMTLNVQQIASTVVLPGTNFAITSKVFGLTLTAQQASLAAGDYLSIYQTIEGPNFRELSSDVHSASILIYSTVAGLKFSLALRDSPTTKSLVKLCTIPNVNTWTLIPLANLPSFPSGNFSSAPGAPGYLLSLAFAIGSNNIAPAADTFQAGNFSGAPGMSNWAASPVNSQIFIAFIQHEPGAQCTTPIDCPFTQNYHDCLRLFCKSYDYGVKPGTVSANGAPAGTGIGAVSPYGFIPFPRPMAKAPTITAYSPTTGAINTLRNIGGGADIGVTSILNGGTSGFGGFGLGSPPGAGYVWTVHYTADTGW